MQAARTYKRKPGAKFVRKTEESEQQRFITWFKRTFPGVIIYTDFGAGLPLTDNERIRMVAMRSRDGMPDIYIDFPTMHVIDGKEVYFCGARLEMKKTGTVIYKKDGTLRKDSYRRIYRGGYVRTGDHMEEQAATLEEYNRAGFFARFAKGIDHAKELANWYMGVPKQASLIDDNSVF